MPVWDLETKFTPQRIAAAFAQVWSISDSRLTASYDARGDVSVCPITCDGFEEPVMLEDGSVYEQHAVLDWLRSHDGSPCTNVRLRHKVALKLTPLKAIVNHLLLTTPKPRLERAVTDAAAAISGEFHDVGRILKNFRNLSASLAQGVSELGNWRVLVSQAELVLQDLRRCLDAASTLSVQSVCKTFLAQSSLRSQRDWQKREMAGSALQLQSRSRMFLAQQYLDIASRRRRQAELSASERCKAVARTFVAKLWLLHVRNLRRRCQLSKQLVVACRGNGTEKLGLVQRLLECRAHVDARVESFEHFATDAPRRLVCCLCDDGAASEAANFSCGHKSSY